MTRRIFLVCFVALFFVPIGAPTSAEERLAMRVSPAVSYTPANLRVISVVASDGDNRAIEVTAESEGFFRSSEVPLEGEGAPRTTVVEFKSLPGGSYTIRAMLKGANGREIARVQKKFDVIETNLGEP